MAKGVSLTPTSYVVLGLLAQRGPCTSYDLKRAVAGSIGYFWSFPHSQLYAEPSRLAQHGLLTEKQERTGRRRRLYDLTDAGREVLEAWLAEPSPDASEIRDPALLQLFFGSSTSRDRVRAIARTALARHEQRVQDYEAIAASQPKMGAHQRATLELGLRCERTAVEFWSELAANPPPTPRRVRRSR